MSGYSGGFTEDLLDNLLINLLEFKEKIKNNKLKKEFKIGGFL